MGKRPQHVKWCMDNEQGVVLCGLRPSSVTDGVMLNKLVDTSVTQLLHH